MAKGLGRKAIDAIEEGGMSVEEAATLAAFSTPEQLQEAADIAFSSAVKNVSGWEDGIDEPDPAIVATGCTRRHTGSASRRLCTRRWRSSTATER